MKFKILLLTCLLGCSLFSFAENGQPNRQRLRARAISHTGNWVGRMGQTDAFFSFVKITEAQKNTLKEKLGEIQTKHAELAQKVRQAAKEQAKLCKAMLETPHKKDPKVYEQIDLIAKCRTEQAKLAIESLIVLRDTLTEEQYPKAREFFKKEIRKRRAQFSLQENQKKKAK